jgi:hypothetical protein
MESSTELFQPCDVLARPLDVIDAIERMRVHREAEPAARTAVSGDVRKGPLNECGLENAVFHRLINEGLLNSSMIPAVKGGTPESIRNNSLCRYRGLVQNVLNPEIFCGHHQGRFLKYRDVTENYHDEGKNSDLLERYDIKCMRFDDV